MLQTLITIDDFWVLVTWLTLGVVYFVIQLFHRKYSEVTQFLPIYIIGGVIIFFVFPNIETMGIDRENPNGPMIPEGLAIRGYGVFLLLAMVAGFGLALLRCQQINFDGDKILSLGFWMVIVGLIGARLFYVIQKFDSFADVNARQLVLKMIDMTSGGLVVYGSLIGGLVAAAVYLAWHKLPWRTVADILAPGMIIGLAIGRIGCLMNGCCYGGVCEEGMPGIRFPAGSAPYVQQLRSGALIGVQGVFEESSGLVEVKSVDPNSLAAESGVQVGDRIRLYLTHQQKDDPMMRLRAAKKGLDEMQVAAVIDTEGQRPRFIPARQLPARSLNTHPTQIYSAINAALLCAFLWFYFPYRRQSGEVFALFLMIYPIGRFLLEIIRRDEMGQFGTSFTISQWVSFGVFVIGLAMFTYVRLVPDSEESTTSEA